jgi:hypothetical protein
MTMSGISVARKTRITTISMRVVLLYAEEVTVSLIRKMTIIIVIIIIAGLSIINPWHQSHGR